MTPVKTWKGGSSNFLLCFHGSKRESRAPKPLYIFAKPLYVQRFFHHWETFVHRTPFSWTGLCNLSLAFSLSPSIEFLWSRVLFVGVSKVASHTAGCPCLIDKEFPKWTQISSALVQKGFDSFYDLKGCRFDQNITTHSSMHQIAASSQTNALMYHCPLGKVLNENSTTQ